MSTLGKGGGRGGGRGVGGKGGGQGKKGGGGGNWTPGRGGGQAPRDDRQQDRGQQFGRQQQQQARPSRFPGTPDHIFCTGEPLPAPSPAVAKAEDALIVSSKGPSVSALSINGSVNIARRPGYGTKGTPIILRTNFFEILPKADLQLYWYDITVLDSKGKAIGTIAARKLKRAFQMFLDGCPLLDDIRPAIATDYRSNLVTVKRLAMKDDEHKEETVVYHEADQPGPKPNNPDKYIFRISFKSVANVQQLMDYIHSKDSEMVYDNRDDVLQVLNIVMARKPASSDTVTSATRNTRFFPVDAFMGDIRGGLIALRGYFSSVRLATARLVLNVNAVTAAFYEPGPLLQVMTHFRDSNGTSVAAVGKFLKGVRVKLTHLPKDTKLPRVQKTIFGTAKGGECADNHEFFCEEIDKSKKITVSTYFKKKYGITLKASKAPLVNVGNAEHPTLMPAELCEVLPGQPARKKLNGEQTGEMIKFAARDPRTNGEYIVGEGARLLGLGASQQDGPAMFGFNIVPEMLTVPGRILPSPSVEYAGRQKAMISKGSWNIASLRFSKGAIINNWTYFQIKWGGERDPLEGRLENYVQMLQEMMRKSGSTVERPRQSEGILQVQRPPKGDPDKGNLARFFDLKFAALRKQGIKMVWIVLPEQHSVLYERLKVYGDTKHGLHTVCSVPAKMTKGGESYMANVAMKFNLKRGGINHLLPANDMGMLAQGKTMVVGIDVTHPSPGSREGAPSIAGVVASINKDCAQWPASIRAQESRKEMVSALADMIIERLRVWQKYNQNNLPLNILVYRDGVSEGQFKTVLEEEAPALDSAVNRTYPKGAVKPKITIAIVGKRHHTRFFPTRDADTNTTHGQRPKINGNPKNGLVVDRGITSERQWDVYIQAHHGLQGTARPAHYTIIKDKIGFTADSFEHITHNLCYLYGRATKAVSICPPAYYADKLCERGRAYLSDALAPPPGDQAPFVWSTAPWSAGVHADLQETMFYV